MVYISCIVKFLKKFARIQKYLYTVQKCLDKGGLPNEDKGNVAYLSSMSAPYLIRELMENASSP